MFERHFQRYQIVRRRLPEVSEEKPFEKPPLKIETKRWLRSLPTMSSNSKAPDDTTNATVCVSCRLGVRSPKLEDVQSETFHIAVRLQMVGGEDLALNQGFIVLNTERYVAGTPRKPSCNTLLND